MHRLFSIAALLSLAPLPAEPLPDSGDVALPPQATAAAPVPNASEVVVLGYGHFAASAGMRGVSAAAFEAQMQYLREQGLIPVAPADMVAWLENRGTLPQRSVLITLDVADSAAYTVAFPILKKYGYPFLIFADGGNFEADGHSLGIKELKEMQLAGGSVGSRTLTCPAAEDWKKAAEQGTEASVKLAEKELGVSAQRITAALGECEYFSFPHGYADTTMLENLPVYGYSVAFSCYGARVHGHSAPLMLPRYMVPDMPSFAAALGNGQAQETARILHRVRDMAAALLPMPPKDEELPSGPDETAAQAELPGGEVVSLHQALPPPQLSASSEDLAPRPVCTLPAAGTLERRTPASDWVSRSFSRPLVPREKTRVAVLGYHDFSNTKPVSEMRMRTAEFCQQMQYIQDAGLTVITMQDFLEWRHGTRCLPERCVLITIDDGWKSVYTDAYPILKAYGYPFTLFLYTSYIQVKGHSLTQAQIREMMEHGATIGSHSTTHYYPSQWKRYAQDSPEYAAQVQQELPDSFARLRQLFGTCSTYCYPGGYHTPPMLESLRAMGIQAAFTVLESKVNCEEPPLLVHRYMVFGTDPRIFRRAVNFDGVPGVKPTAQGITEARARARAFYPAAFETLTKPQKP